MTLISYQSDKLFANKVGVQASPGENTVNPYMREQLLLAMKTLLKQEKHEGKIQVYTHCYDITANFNKTLTELKKEIDYEVATKKVLLEDSKTNPAAFDYDYYQKQVLAYENILNMIEQQIEKGEK